MVRRSRPEDIDFTPILRDACLFGRAYERNRDGTPRRVPTMRELREYWDTDRDAIMAEWPDDCALPAPWAWWVFELGREWPLHVEQQAGGVATRDRYFPTAKERADAEVILRLPADRPIDSTPLFLRFPPT